MNSKQSILVTGTSGGFGLLITKSLAEAGHTVVASMRGVSGKNAAAAEALRSWASERGASVHVVELDVADDASVEAGVAEAIRLAGHLDVVVNNAGVGSFGLTESFTPAQAQSLYNVNVIGVHRVNRAVLPHMRTRGHGLLIHISSGLGRYVIPFLGIYTSTKFALEALAESYRYELAPLGVESVLVQPGAFGTDFSSHSMFGADQSRAEGYGPVAQIPAQMGQNLQAMLSTPDAPKPQEVADAVLNLVQMQPGHRPARTVVDRFNGYVTTKINQTCAELTEGMLNAWHMGALLNPKQQS